MFKRALKLTLLGFIAFVLLIALLIGFMETTWFKNRLKVTVIALLKPAIHGSLQIGSIRGNLFTGLQLDSVVIYSGGNQFASIGRIELEHDVFALLRKKVNVSTLALDRVDVHLVRGRDGVWNFDRIFPPASEQSSGPTAWSVNIGDLHLRHSAFTLTDSASPAFASTAVRRFNPSRFSLTNIRLRGRAFFHNEDLYLDIASAHIDASLPEVKQATLSGVISASSGGIRVTKLALSTGTSDLTMNARLANTNIFRAISSETLGNDSVHVNINSDRLDLDEVSTLFTDAGLMNGVAAVDLDAGGRFGDLNLHRLNLSTRNTVIHVAGTLKNLHHPADITINAILGDSRIDPADLDRIFPNHGLPAFEKAGLQSVSLQFNGRPSNFLAALEIEGKTGKLSANGSLDFNGDIPAYDLKFNSSKLLPDRFIPTLPVSYLSANGSVKGVGFAIDQVSTHCDVSIDSAVIRNIPLGKSTIAADAAPHKFNGKASLNGPEMALSVDGLFDLTEESNPVIRGTVGGTELNLGRVLNDTTLRSSLTFKADLATTGNSVDNLNGTATLALQRSVFRGIPIDSGAISFSIDQRDPAKKSLELKSSYLDAELRGRFDLDIIGAYLTEQIPHLVQSILQHTYTPESDMDRNVGAEKTIARHTKEAEQVDFDYSFRFYNSKSATMLAGITPIDAAGAMTGHITGDASVLAINNTARFDRVHVLSAEKPVYLDAVGLDFNIRNITLTSTLDTLAGTAHVTAGRGFYESVPAKDLRVDAVFGGKRGTFSLDVGWDTLWHVTGSGSAAVEDMWYAVDFDTLKVRNKNIALENAEDVQARIDSIGVFIMRGKFRHDDDYLLFSGGLIHGLTFDVHTQLNGFPLTEMNKFLPPSPGSADRIGLFGTASAEITLQGTTHEPILDVAMTVDSASWRQSELGTLRIGLQYADRTANINLAARMPGEAKPRLTVGGYFPIDLAFVSVQDRIPDRPQELTIHADGYPLDFLEPILPTLENIRGTVTGDLTVRGTPAAPKYSGPLTVQNGRFRFMPNNMEYVLNGDLVPAGDSVTLRNVTLANVEGEKLRGTTRVEGTVSFRDYNLSSFNLMLYGDLLVMSDASAKPMPNMYGPLFAEMGPGGVRFSGTPLHPYLAGTLLVKEASLLFPERVVLTGATGTQLPYIIVDDTTRVIRHKSAPDAGMRTLANEASLVAAQQGTFLTNLRYELTVKTQGKTRIRMIFTTATSEELFADLEGKLEVINEYGTANAFGQIAVGNESYYNFIKKFTATGNLSFDGQWDNPVMNIKAVYSADKLKAPDTLKTSNGSTSERVIVNLDIGGTRYEPKLTMSLQEQTDPTDQNTIRDRTGDVQADALSFLLTGKFRDELTAADNQTVSSVGGTAGSAFAYGIASSVLSDALTRYLNEQFPFIQSATISYQGTQSDLRISSEVGKGYLRAGGRVLNDIGNANVSYQVSVGKLFDLSAIQNLFVEVAHTVDGSIYDESHRTTTTNTARVYYKISF